jgi:hypothetical protein
MTTAADLTVKKYDGTTNIVWSLLVASGGDKAPAVWRSNTANTGTTGQKPTFSMSSRWNAQKTVRRVDVSCSFPSVYTNSSTGQTEVRSVMNFTGSYALPQNITSTDVQEFVAQLNGLLLNSNSVVSIVSGFAPT